MRLEEAKARLIECIERVIKEDAYLLLNDISERAISHRLGVYLTPHFEEFDVDCEYNGNVDADNGRKYIRLLNTRAQKLGLQGVDGNDEEMTSRGVYPDIIVHKRGKNGPDNNLIIIEIKKSSSQVSCEWDREKLCRFTSPEYQNEFKYRYGAFVRFDVGGAQSYSIDWYQNGKIIEN